MSSTMIFKMWGHAWESVSRRVPASHSILSGKTTPPPALSMRLMSNQNWSAGNDIFIFRRAVLSVSTFVNTASCERCVCVCARVCVGVCGCVRVYVYVCTCACIMAQCLCVYICVCICLCVYVGARCSFVVRAFTHGAMGRRIDPSW